MPSACVHLKVAYLLTDTLNISNKADFYLGAVSPDAVNLEGFANEKTRYNAHIRSKDYEVWKENIHKFYADNKLRYFNSYDFLTGFFLHLYTDIAWDEQVQPLLFDYLTSQGYSADDFKEQKWTELYRLNSKIVGENWYNEILVLLKAGKCRDISTVSAELLKDYRNYIADDYDFTDKIADEMPRFLDDSMIKITADKAYDYMKKLLDI